MGICCMTQGTQIGLGNNREGWMGREVVGVFKWEGAWVKLRLIHVDVCQKTMQYYKAIIFQLKTNKLKKRDTETEVQEFTDSHNIQGCITQ